MTLAICIVSALVAALFALIATAASRNCARLRSEMTGALAAVSSQRGTVEGLAGQLDALSDQFRTLRGKFYAERRAAPQVDPPPPTPADLKAQLRQKVGLVPGRRP